MLTPLIFPPRPDLAPWIHHVLVMRLDSCLSRLPSALSPALVVFARGTSLLRTGGALRPVPRASLSGPYLEARSSQIEAGTMFVAVFFRPGRMAEALGPGVGEIRDRIVPLDEILLPSRVRRMLDRIDETDEPAEWNDSVQALLSDCLRPKRDPVRLAGLLAGRRYLFEPAHRIAAELGIGLRQLERRLNHAYGINLRDLRRVARFGYSLARLMAMPPRRGELARIAHEFDYYDQAHMDRDFRALAGLSPGDLMQACAGHDPGFWVYRFSRRDFRNICFAEDVDSIQDQLFSRRYP